MGLSMLAAAQQDVKVGMNVGYATFGMADLASMQRDIAMRLPVEGKITESFPPYWNFSANILFSKPTHYVGFLAGHASTGGRISYGDYSGSMAINQLVGMTYVGPMGAVRVTKHESANLYFGAQLLYYFNNLTVEEIDQIGGVSSSASILAKSKNLALGPFMEVQKEWGIFTLRLMIGGEFHFLKSTIVLNSNPNQFLISTFSTPLKIDPSGFRASLGFFVRL